MRYVIQTAISHGRIKWQITTVGSHGCIIKSDTLLNYLVNEANIIGLQACSKLELD